VGDVVSRVSCSDTVRLAPDGVATPALLLFPDVTAVEKTLCLPSYCLATAVSADLAVSAFSRHATLLLSSLKTYRHFLFSERTRLWRVYSSWRIALQRHTGTGISSGSDGIEPSFLFDWFSGCRLPASPADTSLESLVSSAMVLSRACFRDRRPLLLDSVSFRGTCTGVLASALWGALEPVLTRLSATSSGPLDAPPRLWHTEPPIYRCCPSYMGLNVIALRGALPLSPIVIQDASDSRLHRWRAGRRIPRWTRRWYCRRTPKFQWTPPESQCRDSFLQDGEGIPWCCLQDALRGWLSLGQPCCDIRSGDSHCCSCVDSHQIFFLPCSSVGV
jgi:hypothetical protein